MLLSLANTSCCCPLSGRFEIAVWQLTEKTVFWCFLTNLARESYTHPSEIVLFKKPGWATPSNPGLQGIFQGGSLSPPGAMSILSEFFPVYPRFHTCHTWHLASLGCQAVRFAIAQYPLANPEGWCASVQFFWSVDFDVDFLMSFCCDFLHKLMLFLSIDWYDFVLQIYSTTDKSSYLNLINCSFSSQTLIPRLFKKRDP